MSTPYAAPLLYSWISHHVKIVIFFLLCPWLVQSITLAFHYSKFYMLNIFIESTFVLSIPEISLLLSEREFKANSSLIYIKVQNSNKLSWDNTLQLLNSYIFVSSTFQNHFYHILNILIWSCVMFQFKLLPHIKILPHLLDFKTYSSTLIEGIEINCITGKYLKRKLIVG